MIRDQKHWLSGYRTLWMLVMFDLPVVEREERRAATQFRNILLDQGFCMAQYSIYYRLLGGKESADTMEKKIRAHLPDNGLIYMLVITDKQYENMKIFRGKRYEPQKKPQQLVLF